MHSTYTASIARILELPQNLELFQGRRNDPEDLIVSEARLLAVSSRRAQRDQRNQREQHPGSNTALPLYDALAQYPLRCN